jgi:PilZ domain
MSDPASVFLNRRRSRRQAPKNAAKVFCYKNTMGLGANAALSILDMSETGIRLQVKEPLRQDLEVEINLDILNLRQPIKILGKIIWSATEGNGTWSVGVLFKKPLSYANFTMLTRS